VNGRFNRTLPVKMATASVMRPKRETAKAATIHPENPRAPPGPDSNKARHRDTGPGNGDLLSSAHTLEKTGEVCFSLMDIDVHESNGLTKSWTKSTR
jgi:hypothetical protein